jgi:hypothetical protein
MYSNVYRVTDGRVRDNWRLAFASRATRDELSHRMPRGEAQLLPFSGRRLSKARIGNDRFQASYGPLVGVRSWPGTDGLSPSHIDPHRPVAAVCFRAVHSG